MPKFSDWRVIEGFVRNDGLCVTVLSKLKRTLWHPDMLVRLYDRAEIGEGEFKLNGEETYAAITRLKVA